MSSHTSIVRSLASGDPASQVISVEANLVKSMSNMQPIDLPCGHEKALFGSSTTPSSNVTDHCFSIDHPAVSMWSIDNNELLRDDIHQRIGRQHEEHSLHLEDQDYLGKIREFHVRLDMVKNIVRPGCSCEILNTALSFMSSLARILSDMPLKQKLHASL